MNGKPRVTIFRDLSPGATYFPCVASRNSQALVELVSVKSYAGAEAAPPLEGDAAAPPPVPPPTEPWLCATCTFRNSAGAAACSMCNAPAPAPTPAGRGPDAGAWKCGACTYENVGGTKCDICQTARPAPEPGHAVAAGGGSGSREAGNNTDSKEPEQAVAVPSTQLGLAVALLNTAFSSARRANEEDAMLADETADTPQNDVNSPFVLQLAEPVFRACVELVELGVAKAAAEGSEVHNNYVRLASGALDVLMVMLQRRAMCRVDPANFSLVGNRGVLAPLREAFDRILALEDSAAVPGLPELQRAATSMLVGELDLFCTTPADRVQLLASMLRGYAAAPFERDSAKYKILCSMLERFGSDGVSELMPRPTAAGTAGPAHAVIDHCFAISIAETKRQLGGDGGVAAAGAGGAAGGAGRAAGGEGSPLLHAAARALGGYQCHLLSAAATSSSPDQPANASLIKCVALCARVLLCVPCARVPADEWCCPPPACCTPQVHPSVDTAVTVRAGRGTNLPCRRRVQPAGRLRVAALHRVHPRAGRLGRAVPLRAPHLAGGGGAAEPAATHPRAGCGVRRAAQRRGGGADAAVG